MFFTLQNIISEKFFGFLVVEGKKNLYDAFIIKKIIKGNLMNFALLKATVVSCVIGLATISSLVFASDKKDDKKFDPETVLAKLNDKEFKLKDAAAMIQALGPQLGAVPLDKLLSILRDAWLQEQIYIQEAKKESLQKSPEYKDALRRVKRQILIEVYLAKTSERLVTEDKLRKAYDEEIKKKYSDSNKEEVKVQHIQVKSKAKALEVIELLNKEAIDFDQAIAKFSESKENNGVIGYVSELTDSLIPPVREAALSLKKVGDYTKTPVKMGNSYLIFKALDRRKIKAPSFEDLSPQLSRQIARDEMKKNFEKLKKAYKVKEYPLPELPKSKEKDKKKD